MSRVWRFLARTWPWLFLWELSLVAWLLLLSYFTLGRRGHLDWAYHAIGRDFINYWTAAHLVRSGQVADIFYPPLFLQHEHALFDPRLPFHFWSYPPPNLLLVLPLGWLSYMDGLWAWSLAGVAALAIAACVWTRRHWERWLLVFSPATATNIGLGQNGGFTGALMLAGLKLFDSRPLLAGGLLGLLIFKPQIAVMLPVAVLAGRRWKVMGAAAVSVVAVLAVSYLAFGPVAWRGFFGPTLTTQGLMLSHGHGPFQWMMPSAYMSARILLHAKMGEALAVQAPFTLLAVVLTAWGWRRESRPLELRAAVLMVATFVASPQGFNYDLLPASAAAVVLLRRDPCRWLAIGLVILTWALPVAMIGFQYIHAPIAPLVLSGLMIRLATLSDETRETVLERRRARRAERRVSRAALARAALAPASPA